MYLWPVSPGFLNDFKHSHTHLTNVPKWILPKPEVFDLRSNRWRHCSLTCCWCCSLAPYRCRLATNSTSTVKCSATHRKPSFRCPRPLTTTVPRSPQLKPTAASSAVQLFSSWSPILRRRDASSWATEHGEGRRELQADSPGSSNDWSTGSQHIFSSRRNTRCPRFKFWGCRTLLLFSHQPFTVFAPPFSPTPLYCIIHYSVTWCRVYIIFSQKSDAIINSWISAVCCYLRSFLLLLRGFVVLKNYILKQILSVIVPQILCSMK